MNDLLKFDIYAMIHPKNDRDIAAMLKEAIAEIKSVNRTLDAMLECEAIVHQHA